MKINQLTIAVLAAITSYAYAEQPKDTAELSEIVVTDRQGAKVQTNIVTLAEKMNVPKPIYAVYFQKSRLLNLPAVTVPLSF